MDFYSISGNEGFIVYGAGFQGQQICDNLLKNNIKVEAFLDRRVKTASPIYTSAPEFQGDRNLPSVLNEIPVFHPDSMGDVKAENIVIIAVTNPYEHPIIADMLYTMGYRKILCSLPSNGWKRQGIEENNEIYNLIAQGVSPIGKEAVYYDDMRLMEKHLTDMMDVVDEKTCMAQIPMELLFYTDSDGKEKSIYAEDGLLPFYNFIEGRGEKEFLVLRGHLQDNGIDINRWMETKAVSYFQLSQEWENGENNQSDLPFVERIDRGRFLIKSHLERIIFYVAKGYHRIYCKLTQSDYIKWDKPELINEVWQTIMRQRISCVYTPVLYPAFYWFQCRRESYGHSRLMRICRYFVEKEISLDGKKVLDAGAYVGYFAQHMYRMGAAVTAVEFDTDNYELLCAISSLVDCNGIKTLNIGIQEMDENEFYDVTILLTVLYWHFDTDLGLKLMEKIDKLTKGILLWESGDEPEREKQWIFDHSSFNAYEKIGDTFGTQKLREMGVFYRV